MRAPTWREKRDVRVDTVPDPKIVDPTVSLVRITSTRICGSDPHLYRDRTRAAASPSSALGPIGDMAALGETMMGRAGMDSMVAFTTTVGTVLPP
ncbi:hypothetical protein [Streptomyces sp. NPDC127033]|uniref:hypothetical protein n=1 Tax=Streptomyces sp. NPDC127033 TaxID=3347110 RepID=UPI003648F1BC